MHPDAKWLSVCFGSRVLHRREAHAGQECYYERSVPRGVDDYYADLGESPGIWTELRYITSLSSCWSPSALHAAPVDGDTIDVRLAGGGGWHQGSLLILTDAETAGASGISDPRSRQRRVSNPR